MTSSVKVALPALSQERHRNSLYGQVCKLPKYEPETARQCTSSGPFARAWRSPAGGRVRASPRWRGQRRSKGLHRLFDDLERHKGAPTLIMAIPSRAISKPRPSPQQNGRGRNADVLQQPPGVAMRGVIESEQGPHVPPRKRARPASPRWLSSVAESALVRSSAIHHLPGFGKDRASQRPPAHHSADPDLGFANPNSTGRSSFNAGISDRAKSRPASVWVALCRYQLGANRALHMTGKPWLPTMIGKRQRAASQAPRS